MPKITVIDITPRVRSELQQWGEKRGALNFHPAYVVQKIERAYRISGFDEGRLLCSVQVDAGFSPVVEGAQLHIIALHENSAGKLRAVQFHFECAVAVNKKEMHYETDATGANWSVAIPFDRKVEDIFYCDLKGHRVPHDKVPKIAGFAIVQLSGYRTGGSVVAAISKSIKEGRWHVEDDVDVIGEGEQIKLRDPIMGGEIQVPVRPQHCEHAQCYDIATVVQIMGQTSSKHFRCAVCNVECDFTDLIFDKTFLNYMKLVRQLDARFKHQGVQRAAEAYHRVPTKLYETVARLQDPTNADERTQTDLLRVLCGKATPAAEQRECVDVDSLSSDDVPTAQKARAGKRTLQSTPSKLSPKKKLKVASRSILSVVSKTATHIVEGAVMAFICPPEDGGTQNVVVLAKVMAVAQSVKEENIATLRVRELKRVHADPPYFVSCATQWDEQSDSAAPVDGVWVSLPKSEHIHGETEAFELAEGEDTRLANLALDTSE